MLLLRGLVLVLPGHQHNFAGKERPKGRKGPGRPPKRSCALGAQNSRGVKRRKSANSAKVHNVVLLLLWTSPHLQPVTNKHRNRGLVLLQDVGGYTLSINTGLCKFFCKWDISRGAIHKVGSRVLLNTVALSYSTLHLYLES